MKTGKRYLIKSSFDHLFEVRCLEVTNTAYKVRFISALDRDRDEWIPKSNFGQYGKYSIYEEL